MTPLLTAFTGTPEKNQVYNLDLFDLCAAMPSQSVDMILADLPYEATPASWDILIPFDPMWTAFKRIIKPRGAIVLTASQPFTSALVMSNLAMFRYSGVWDKVSKGDIFNAKNKPLKQHEDILYFSMGTVGNGSSTPMNYYPQGVQSGNRIANQTRQRKGAFFESRKSHSDVYECSGSEYPSSIIRFSNADRTEAYHPTQKPVDLFRYLIRTYTEVGQVVFDPCVGSGTTAIAAREEGRSFIVGDSSLEYVEIARARLAAPYTPSFMPQLDLSA